MKMKKKRAIRGNFFSLKTGYKRVDAILSVQQL
jgi:hypothetical protein